MMFSRRENINGAVEFSPLEGESSYFQTFHMRPCGFESYTPGPSPGRKASKQGNGALTDMDSIGEFKKYCEGLLKGS